MSPFRPAHPCNFPGCPRLVATGARCSEHTAATPKRFAPSTGYGGPTWKRIRLAQLGREPYCRKCLELGRVTLAAQVDHIVRTNEGGSDEPDNLASLCAHCHSRKTLAENNQRRG